MSGASVLSRLSFVGLAKEPTTISAPTNGALTQTVAGSLAGATYYVKSTWVNGFGETVGSAETSLAVSVNNVLNVAAPASAPSNATGWNVYVSTGAGTETKQNTTPIAIGTPWVEPTTGLITGAAVPGANTALGIGAYTPPSTGGAILPVNGAPAFEDTFVPLRDESIRNNDSVLQGLYQGVGDSASSWDMNGYPDLIGHLLRASVGPDTITGAAVGTTLSSNAAVGASNIVLASATGVVAGQTLMLDSGANVEYVKVGPGYTSGTTVPITIPLTIAHSSGVAVVSQTKHVFAQSNTRMPSYSLTDYEAGIESRGYPGCVLDELAIKIDPKGIVTFAPKWMGWPSSIQSNPTPSWTKAQPFLGWQWAMTNGGASSNRGVSLDWTIKREVEAIHASTGSQNPEEVFPGALTLEGTYKARFVDDTDMNLFLNYVQSPVTAALIQPTAPTQMGAQLIITTSQGGVFTGKKNVGGKYLDADFSIAGINNATDSGTLAVTLWNFTTTAY